VFLFGEFQDFRCQVASSSQRPQKNTNRKTQRKNEYSFCRHQSKRVVILPLFIFNSRLSPFNGLPRQAGVCFGKIVSDLCRINWASEKIFYNNNPRGKIINFSQIVSLFCFLFQKRHRAGKNKKSLRKIPHTTFSWPSSFLSKARWWSGQFWRNFRLKKPGFFRWYTIFYIYI